jgi:hypothetical protein
LTLLSDTGGINGPTKCRGNSTGSQQVFVFKAVYKFVEKLARPLHYPAHESAEPFRKPTGSSFN